MTKSTRVTIKSVAQDAGVSVSAVSKVLRNAYGVSDALKEKVETSILKLGYRPNTAARGMRGKTFTIGVLVSDLRNPFVPDLIDGARDAAAKAGYRIMIGVGRADKSNEQDLVNSMIDQQMDGLILIGTRLPPDEVEKFGLQVPTVCLAYHHSTARNFDTVNSDDVAGARCAVEHLIKGGRKRISMLSLNEYENFETNVFYQREVGYKSAMRSAGLESFIIIHRLSDPIRRQPNWVHDFLSNGQTPEAVFCWSDLDAISLLSAVEDEGRSVPESLSIVGFDGSPLAALPQVGLTSVAQNGTKLGYTTFETLLSRIDGRSDVQNILVQTTLDVRRSSDMNC